MIDRLAGQGLWLRTSRRFGLGVIDAVCVLHQRVEAAPVRPRTFVAVSAERHVDDAGPQLREFVRAEAVALHGARPVALHEDVGLPRERGECSASTFFAQIDEGRELAATI